ncbi:MAG: hypothetical protein IKD36_00225 [Clostridia bacterium]|nr:hypothetical protein [Clostridia bacterium]
MKLKMKKYPLLISAIVSCVVIIASLFILGFFGLKVGTSLGGGSQFSVNVKNGDSPKKYIAEIKDILSDNGLSFDSSIVDDNYVATEVEGEYTKQVVVIKISNSEVKDSVEEKVVSKIATKLGIDESYISSIEDITSSTTGKNVLNLGIAIGIIAIALFVFAWIRYDLFAGLSFIVAFLHNIILYLALTILTRLELNLTSLTVLFIITLVMSWVLIAIYEKYRRESRLHISDKLTIYERMVACEKQAVKPFVIVAAAVIVAIVFMLFVPVTVVKFTALNILISMVVTAYTALLIGPASYVALLEVRDVRLKAVLSRNDTVNKVIKKKIKNSKKAKAEEEKAAAQAVEEAPAVQEEKPKKQTKKEEPKEVAQEAPKKRATQKTIKKDYSKFKK